MTAAPQIILTDETLDQLARAGIGAARVADIRATRDAYLDETCPCGATIYGKPATRVQCGCSLPVQA